METETYTQTLQAQYDAIHAARTVISDISFVRFRDDGDLAPHLSRAYAALSEAMHELDEDMRPVESDDEIAAYSE